METTFNQRGSLNKGESSVGQGLQQVVRQGEEVIKTAAADVGEAAKEARAQLTSAIDAAKETCSKLQDKVVEGAKITDRAVREHPYPSLGLAFGVGLLIGFLCQRKG